MRSQWRRLSFETKLGLVFVPVLLALLSGLALPLVLRATEGGPAPAEPGAAAKPTPTAAPRLEVIDLAVTGGRLPGQPGGSALPTRVDVTVRNSGDLVSIVKRIGFRVRAFGFIEICQGGAAEEPSAEYELALPKKPRIGQEYIQKVSQRVKPAGVDRFTVRL